MQYETILTNQEKSLGIIAFNRPQALNAISIKLREELNEAIRSMSEDEQIKVIILTGNKKAFAAGADIKEMQSKSYMDMYLFDNASNLQTTIQNCQKPMIAAVSGYALGGGCELAMMCDFIVAAENAKFGQPEISIGALPGWGGTQRLTGLIGKSKAMDMCLTGRMMGAEEAERSGLVARVFALENFMDEVKKIAASIASHSAPINSMIKECINQSLETNLQSGLLFERRQFQSVFATNDQKEGMSSFVEKRHPEWTHS